jgi:hypothetical protein
MPFGIVWAIGFAYSVGGVPELHFGRSGALALFFLP